MTQSEAQTIAFSEDFKLKSDHTVTISVRENHILTTFIHQYFQDNKLKKVWKKQSRELIKNDENISLDEEVGRLYEKLLTALFTRDPEASRIRAIAEGNLPPDE